MILSPPEVGAFGKALTVTRYGAVVTAHGVNVLVSVTCTHPEPAVPHVTVMEFPVDDPMIVPPLLIVQL